MKAEIKKIVLDLGGKEISLTPKQARKLYELLDEIYGKQPIIFKNYPVYIDRWNNPYWRNDIFTWSSSETITKWDFDDASGTVKLTL